MSKFYVKHNKSQVMRKAHDEYLRSEITSLNECYRTYSYAKEQAMQRCHEINREFNGCGCYILGANNNFFSVGFVGEYEGRKAFFYITYAQTRFIYMEEL